MPKALSIDLRSRVAALVASGVSRRAAGAQFGISASSAIRYARLQSQNGNVSARPMGRPPGSGKLAAHVDFLVEVVESVPDITGSELAAALADARGITVHPSSVRRALLAKGFTYKKIASGGGMWAR